MTEVYGLAVILVICVIGGGTTITCGMEKTNLLYYRGCLGMGLSFAPFCGSDVQYHQVFGVHVFLSIRKSCSNDPQTHPICRLCF